MGGAPSKSDIKEICEPFWLPIKGVNDSWSSVMNPKCKMEQFRVARPSPDDVPEYKRGGKFAEVQVDGEREVVMAKTGRAANKPMTVMEVFEKAAKRGGTFPAFKVEREGKMLAWTWQEYYDEVLCMARAFLALGLKRHGSVNILGFNSPEWFIADVAAIAAGGKAAGIYTTNGPEACKYITDHSEASIVVVENFAQLSKYLSIRDTLPDVKAYIMWEGELPKQDKDGKKLNLEGVYTWKQAMDLGKQDKDGKHKHSAELKERIASQKPGHCCTLIYTSGTTGNPKAVMISHDNVTWTTSGMLDLIPRAAYFPESHTISYLPLSHIAAQMLDIHVPIFTTAMSPGRATIHFAKPDALKGSLLGTLQAVRPTYFLGVPRVWEKFQEGMEKKGAAASGLQKSLSTFAKATGELEFSNIQIGGDNDKRPSIIYLKTAEIVFNKVKVALGLDRCAVCFSSAAPISKHTINYFGQLGIQIFEIYGMSECTGPQTAGITDYFKVGSVGVALPGTELLIDHQKERGDKEGEGEICYRGRHIMMGYMKDAKKTAEAIDPEGWLHSGDVGKVDDKGVLYITGRLKELIISAGGENIAPVPVEDEIKRAGPAIANCMMVGDRRQYNVVLVAPRVEIDINTGVPSNKLDAAALAVGDAKTVEECSKDPKWINYMKGVLKKSNDKAVSNAQKVQYFRFVTDFSIPGGELTPTLKLKRSVVAEKHSNLIEEMYGPKPDLSADSGPKLGEQDFLSSSKRASVSAAAAAQK